MKSNTEDAGILARYPNITNLDFRHYIMGSLLQGETHLLNAETITRIFNSGRDLRDRADAEFVYRRFHNWCAYHGLRLGTETDHHTGKVIRYSLTPDKETYPLPQAG